MASGHDRQRRRFTRALGLAVVTACWLAPAVRAAAPALGPAREVDRAVLTGAPGDQTAPAAAYLGGSDGAFVVLWRTALWEGEVRAARVTAAGIVREPRGVVLPGLEGTDARAAIAAGGGHLLVVGAAEGKLLSLRLGVEADGALSPGAPVLLASAPAEQLGRPAVAWNGSSFWVLWSQGPAGLLALRVSAAGQPLDPAPLRLSLTPGHPALVWGGERTLAVWSTVAGGQVVVRAARLDGGGLLLDQPARDLGSLAGARAGPTAVAWSGSSYLVAAAGEDGPAGAAAIAAIRLTRDGHPVDAAPITLAQLATAPEGGPAAIWNGGRFLVLWGETRGQPAIVAPEGRLVSAEGAVSALGLPGLGAAGEQPVVVAGDGQALALLARAPGGRGDLDIRGVRVGPDGAAAGADFLISGGLNWQGNPALAAAGPAANRGLRLFLAWEDARQDRMNGDIHATLLDDTGAPVDPAAIALATGTAAQRAPAVAWDGRNFQAVWQERGRGLVASRVGVDGAVIDRPALLVPGTAGRPALSDPVLCGDDAGALLVFSAGRDPNVAGAPAAELRAVRIPPGGNAKDAASVALLATRDVSIPPVMRLACAADAALLIWSGLYEEDRSNFSDLQMALIPRQGELAPPRVTLLEREEIDEGPTVASDGRGFLVAWRPRQPSGGRVAIFGTRVDAAGVGIDMPARELGALNAGHRVSAYWDGAQYLLVGIQSLAVGQFELRGRVIPADLGGAPGGDWFAIDQVASRRGTGALAITAGLGNGAGLVVYEAFADDDATSNQRLKSRLIGEPATAPVPSAPADAGPPPDAGANDRSRLAKSRGGGCDCAIGRGSPAAPLWLALMLLAVSAGSRCSRGRASTPRCRACASSASRP